MALSMYAAKDFAKTAGIDEARFVEVANKVFEGWKKMKAKHPMGSMF